MGKITNFLNIEFSNNLLTPSVFGQSWLGNFRAKEKILITKK